MYNKSMLKLLNNILVFIWWIGLCPVHSHCANTKSVCQSTVTTRLLYGSNVRGLVAGRKHVHVDSITTTASRGQH